jgi:lipopolysaccharide transport system ATP-binding protein
MSETVIEVEGIGKQYRLGQVGTSTISHDLRRWWYRINGKDDPYLKLGGINTLNRDEGEIIWAIKDISFEVKRGEILGIIGKNGAGKSTLLKIISRVTGPTVGTIKAKGRIASLLEVGTGFHPELSGKENIYLNGGILGMTKAEIKSKFDEIVDFSGIGRYIDTPVKRYSSGMFVRLAFAVAAHLEPEILIIDEVLAVGDLEFQKKCLGKIKDVSIQGRTVIFVSHNMAAVNSMCTRCCMLKNGEVLTIGNTMDVAQRYMHDNISSNDTKVTKHIPADAERIGTGECRFTFLSLFDEERGETSNIFFRETIKLRYKIKAFARVPNITYWMRIFSADGIEIVMTESIRISDAIDPGEYEYQVEIPLILIPGEYYITPSANWGGVMCIDSIEKALTFEVLKMAKNGPEGYRWEKAYGYVYSEAKWTKKTIKKD